MLPPPLLPPTTIIAPEPLLQSRILRFGLLVDGDVGVGVFPEGEEILICGAGFIARGGVCCGIERVSAGQSETAASLPCLACLRRRPPTPRQRRQNFRSSSITTDC